MTAAQLLERDTFLEALGEADEEVGDIQREKKEETTGPWASLCESEKEALKEEKVMPVNQGHWPCGLGPKDQGVGCLYKWKISNLLCVQGAKRSPSVEKVDGR